MSAFPFPALLVRPPLAPERSYTDSCGVKRVDVIEYDRPKRLALVRQRCGRRVVKKWVAWASLATTPEKAAALLRPYLLELAARPAITALPGMTAAGSEPDPAEWQTWEQTREALEKAK